MVIDGKNTLMVNLIMIELEHDTFEDKKVHFLDLLIDRNTTGIFYKDIKIPILVNIAIITALSHGN